MPLIVFDKGIVRKAKLEDYMEAVYALASIVPPGKVTTYGAIAKLINVSPRLIGRILAANENPIIIPCHRIVGSNGDLKGYSSGGVRVKKKILELEGVKVFKDKIARNYILEDLLHRGAGWSSDR